MRRLCVALLPALGAVCWTVAVARGTDAKVELEIAPDETVVARGAAVGVEVLGSIARGWHINAHKPNQPFLKPTVLTLTTPEGVSVDPVNYPRPEARTFAFAGGAELLVYQGKLGMTTAVRVPAGFAGERIRIAAVLQYQACDDTTCLRPSSVSAAIELAVAGHAAPEAAPPTQRSRAVGGCSW